MWFGRTICPFAGRMAPYSRHSPWKGLVRLSILGRYAQLQDEKDEIPCAKLFSQAGHLQKLGMLDKVLLERLEKKASWLLNFQNNQQNWEETTYQWLGQHFGFKLNDPAFCGLHKTYHGKYCKSIVTPCYRSDTSVRYRRSYTWIWTASQ